MTRLHNDPAAFADELLDGFAAANASRVVAVDGGVVRRSGSAGRVAVVIGGGSGHYPAFAGLVGDGLAAGAAMGNVFASPSTRQVTTVATASEGGAGVLLSYGNYAGDVLNFDAAQEALRRAGIPVETVVVTDDISSAPADERHKRRGVAGDLFVFKVAAAAADEGLPLAEVAEAARRANDRLRTLGVAFSGCTLPGAGAPLFDVAPGRMAVGMGIHGEPGLREVDLPSADELAALLVQTLLAEVPDGVDVEGARVVPMLNGLGTVKYEELFVVYRDVARLLEAAGVIAVEPEVGEFCTSFDMAGVSLSLLWLDDDLERWWTAPVDAPAYRRGGSIAAREAPPVEARPERAVATVDRNAATPASRAAAARVVEAIQALAAVIDANADELGRIDAVAGDGDHGIGMQRGVTAATAAAVTAAADDAGAGSVLTAAADAWSDRAGGTSGALWGVMLRALGRALGDTATPDAAAVAAGVSRACDDLMNVGKAAVGDKTMVDAVVPFADALAEHVGAGDRLAVAWQAAAATSTDAAAATADLLPRMGRARPHAERSLGTPDAGAHSFALAVTAVGKALAADTPVPTAPERSTND